jgi:hypothetical protein
LHKFAFKHSAEINVAFTQSGKQPTNNKINSTLQIKFEYRVIQKNKSENPATLSVSGSGENLKM